MVRIDGRLLTELTGGATLKRRIQHPEVREKKYRDGWWWMCRYWHDEALPNGELKTTRKELKVTRSRGDESVGKREAERNRDTFLDGLYENAPVVNGAPVPPVATPAAPESEEGTAAAPARATTVVVKDDSPVFGAMLFGKLAEMWEQDYVKNPKVKLATPTREKYSDRLKNHIMPRWKGTRLAEFENTKAILDWLHGECTSWYMMADLRNIMSGIFTRAQEWNILPRTFANPIQYVRIGKSWKVRPDRILTEEETVDVFSRLQDPHLLICEICLSTGTRISEVVGLQLHHFDARKGTITIEQRHCRGDVDRTKTAESNRVLTLGTLTTRVQEWIKAAKLEGREAWLFPQDNTAGCRKNCSGPMWDSGIRKVLKAAAKAAKCDFAGFGLHSFRRANITLRQEVGGSGIEAQLIAGHANVSMTGKYTKIRLERQDELTRGIQARMEEARVRVEEEKEREKAKKPAKQEAAA